ncbi:flagellar assembly protein A [Campylobacter majalis]|uniref:flagellar assembly protein A n=1 Tax=Campylobacter majalis TaxID=2790656 RepID=UPI003D6952D7
MSEIVYFTPIHADTKTPHQDIKELSKSSGVSAEFIDFRLIDFTTSYTNEKNPNPIELSKDKLKIFDDREFYLDPTLNIQQTYHVEYYDTRRVPKPVLPRINIGANNSLTKVVATISASRDATYETGYDNLLYEYIAKQLIRVGILIGIRDYELRQTLTRVSSVLRIKEMIDTDYTFNVTIGVDPRPAVDSELIYRYKNKINNIDKNDKIDHAARGYVLGVVPDEIIIEYIKPKAGGNGRNVRGEFLKTQDPKEEALKEINISENIQRLEDDKTIKFIAKKAGFVSEEKGVFDIKDELEVTEVSFRQTGSIKTEMNSNVSIVIKEDDIFKDAIGSGVVVEAKEVSVKGSVAANAKVVAERVKIGGQTHAKANIKAKDAEIAVHIGYVEADEVRIDRLEGGTVVAKNVVIKSVVGGSITADKITIETLGSNCTIKALELIDVKFLRGMNNKFIIDASMMQDKGYDVEGHVKRMNEIEDKMQKMPKILEKHKHVIDSNKDSVYAIKAKIEELSKSNVIPPVTFMKKLKEYQQLVGEYNALLREYNSIKFELNDLKTELDIMQNGILSAKVVNRSNWLELNEVKFILVDPPTEVSYLTKQNEMARVMKLAKINDDGEIKYEIRKSNDLNLLPKLKEDS